MLSIAIIHSEKNILTALRMALQADGFDVKTFASTGEAEGLIEYPPDLYVLPRRSQPLSGVAFFKRIRQRSNVPVIFLTANPEVVQEELVGYGRQPSEYIEMPFSQRQVVQRVRALLYV
jgi:two-component system, OmpR family, response regulator ChvI